MAQEPFPDAEAVAIKHLRTDQTVAQARVYGEIPKTPQWPLITLHRSGGLPQEKHSLDRPIIQVDAWSESKQEARLMAAQARASLMRLEGQKVSVLQDGAIEVGGSVSHVEDVQGLTPQPDPDRETIYHYLFSVAITLRKSRA